MMVRRKSSTVAADSIYVSLDSFATVHPETGVPVTVTRGRRLRGDNALVQQHPGFFGPDGLDDAEREWLAQSRGLRR